MCTRMRYRLTWEAGGERVSHVLPPGETILGSGSDCDVRLCSEFVSRRHASLSYDGSTLTITDLGSKNGTRVHGCEVGTALLSKGDTIQLGPVCLEVEAIDPDDAILGLAAGDTGMSRSRGPFTPDPETKGYSTRRVGSSEPVLNALRRALAGLSDRPGSSGAVLDALADSLGLGGCALLRRRRGKHLEVLGRRGDSAVLLQLEGNLAKLAATAGSDRSSESIGESVAAIRRGPDGAVWMLAAWGNGLERGALAPVVEAMLDIAVLTQVQVRTDTPGPPAAGPRGLRFPTAHVVGRSRAMQVLYNQISRLASGVLPILITGETGVGKEHVAQILHLSSPRREGPFEGVNCAAIPAELLESELFGIERGVATGVSQRAGKMLLASGGVLFLDEIGDMPMPLQAKLLRAIQQREALPVGGRRGIPVDVWLLAATNADPVQLMESGRLRRDLYYRLAGCTLRVPPLRERRDDLPPLIEHVLAQVARETGRASPGVTVKALRALCEAPWPGNVRQLEHEVRRLALLCPDGQPIDSTLLAPEILAPAPVRTIADFNGDLNLRTHVEALEQALIGAALTRTRGNQSKAAELLGISRDGLRLKLARLQPRD